MSALLSFIDPAWIVGIVGIIGAFFLGGRQGANKERMKRAEGTKDSLKHQRKDIEDAAQVDDDSLADRISRGG